MLWFNRHRRFLGRLSAYIDGQLSPGESEALEAHLTGCPSCRRHLEELQATVLALRDLPQEEVPRSFALTPEQAARPAPPPPTPRPAPLSTGMPRLVGAALAFTLAVVLVIDLGDLGGDGGQESLQEAAIPAEMAAPAGEQPAEEDALSFVDDDAQTEEAAPPEAGVERETLGAVPTPPAAEGLEGAAPPAAGELTPAAPSPAPAQQAPALGQPGGGLDPLRAAEIALAATLALLVAGSLTLAFARRKK